MIVQKYIIASTYLDDADIPLTSQLLNMVTTRAWTGKDVNINRPSLMHAMDGLSPFTMLDLNEYQAALLNDEQELLNTASLVSVSDIRVQRNKIKISIPVKADKCMIMLKRYANLLYYVFTDSCPFFKALLEVIRALSEYSCDAHKHMTMSNKG